METAVANLDLAAAINILNALVSLTNENTNFKAIIREQQSLLAEQPDNPSPVGDDSNSPPKGKK